MKQKVRALLCLAGWAFSIYSAAQLHSADNQNVLPLAAEQTEEQPQLKAAVAFAEKSVLSSGKWVKVSVETTGIKQLSHSTLKKMGFANPAAVAVYGNGGKELPMSNSSARTDDLAKLPVVRTADAILFYAEGVETWTYNSKARFVSNQHKSDKNTYYYITEGEPSEAPAEVDMQGKTPTRTFEMYDYRQSVNYHNTNLLNSGRTWWSNAILPTKPTHSHTFEMTNAPAADATGIISVKAAGRSGKAGTIAVKCNNVELGSNSYKEVSQTSSTSSYASDIELILDFSPAAKNKVDVIFGLPEATARGWVSYITIVADAKLEMAGANQLLFRTIKSYTKRAVSEYKIAGASENTLVWDVSDPTKPKQMKTVRNGQSLTFLHQDKSGSEFVAFESNGKFEEPKIVCEVANQNLHGQNVVNYAIITHPDFLAQAERLAQLHRKHSGISVVVTTTEQIYNEFSSGKTEATAIREYLRMLYSRNDSVVQLRNALLFGNGNFDPFSQERNKVPSYQSSISLHQTQTYATDDFFGWLAKTDGVSDLTSRMRIGIGRFPVTTPEEAQIVVDKTERYLTNNLDGAWRNRVVFIGDDGDENEHVGYADRNAQTLEELHPDLNVSKIYIEAYAPETTSIGIRYPKAIDEFNNYINNGAILINYVGHGGYNALGGEMMLPQTRIPTFTNPDKLAFLIAATCDFAPFDNLAFPSAGEDLVLLPNSGFVSVFSTTRTVFGDSNFRINNEVMKRILSKKENGEAYTLGEAVSEAKVATGSLLNSLKFVLLGDPALSLRQKETLVVQTDSINGEAFEAMPRIAALQMSSIAGSVRNADSTLVSDFNGQVAITIYDKLKTRKTNGSKSKVFTFTEYYNVLYNGLVEVRNGRFSMDFSLSKDIDMSEGFGRVSYYAVASDKRNATGASNEILIGGIATDAANDTTGPSIRAWIDYPAFVDGGVTGNNPVLYAEIEDPSCINTSGTGIGHDLSLVIDGDRTNPVTLNNTFIYDVGSSTKGKLTYVLRNMADGQHSVTLKAWDNVSNSQSLTLNFVADSRSDIRFEKVEIFPQPYTSRSSNPKLRFIHNEGAATLDITLEVYSMNGRLLDQAAFSTVAGEYQTETIDLGSMLPKVLTLPKGIYVLRMKVHSTTDRNGELIKKLMIGQ